MIHCLISGLSWTRANERTNQIKLATVNRHRADTALRETENMVITNPDNNSAAYTCTHGGPGELVVEDKKLFILSYEHNLRQLQEQMVRALYPQIVAAELSLLEQMIASNSTIRGMVDQSLVKLLFRMATNEIITCKGKSKSTSSASSSSSSPSSLSSPISSNVEQSKVYARCAIYLSTYLQHSRCGDSKEDNTEFWSLLNTTSPEEQSQRSHPLYFMHVGIGQIATDNGLVKLLNAQLPCQCLKIAFPALVET